MTVVQSVPLPEPCKRKSLGEADAAFQDPRMVIWRIVLSLPGRVLWGVDAERRLFGEEHWKAPGKWANKQFAQCDACGWRGNAAKAKVVDRPGESVHFCPSCESGVLRKARMRVFCASMADVFDNRAPVEERVHLFRVIAATPELDWLLLTKRIGNALPMMLEVSKRCGGGTAPMDNVWLGATVVNQEEADRDIPKLLAVPARVRFLSIEPMLGPIDLSAWLTQCDHGSRPGPGGVGGVMCSECGGTGHGCNRLHWVIAGGESGHGARPAHPDWFRSLRDQCAAADVPFHFKQHGEWAPYDRGRHDGSELATPYSMDEPMQRFGKKLSGRLLDGVTHDAFPIAAAR